MVAVMPVSSQLQRRAMYAAKEGHSTLGIPQKVGAEFIAASHGIKGLPKRKKPDKKRERVFGRLGGN
jgi:hypothetical protein